MGIFIKEFTSINSWGILFSNFENYGLKTCSIAGFLITKAIPVLLDLTVFILFYPRACYQTGLTFLIEVTFPPSLTSISPCLQSDIPSVSELSVLEKPHLSSHQSKFEFVSFCKGLKW